MKTLLIAALTLVTGSTFAAEHCERRTITPADVTTIAVELNKTVHLVFADPILRPVIGNSDEWEQFGEPTMPLHLWVLPRRTSSPDAQTSLTVVTAAGAYDFILRRSAVVGSGTVCMHFGLPQSISALAIAPLAVPASNEPANRFTSSTQYRWRGDAIARVSDDGLYTYITLTKAPRSLPTVLGEGAPVTTEYDEETLTFRIAGLFDALQLVQGKKRVEIKRAS